MLKWKGSPKLSFFTLCFAAFLDWLSYGLVYPFFAVLIFRHDSVFLVSASDASRGFWLGVLIAASPLGQLFASPVLGTLSDKIGRKITLQVTCLVIVLGYFLSAVGLLEKSLFLLIFGRVVTGIGAGNISVINSSAADLSHPDQKAKNFALITMANGIGFTAGPFIGGKLATLGFNAPFIAAGLLSLVAFFFFTFLFTETNSKREDSGTSFLSRLRRSVNLSSFGKFRVLFPAFFIFCFGWSFYWEFIPVTWIKVYGLDVSHIGNFYAYGSAFYVLSCGLFIRPILKKFKSMPILIWASAALGICFALLLHANVKMYWVLIPIQQFLIALIFPVGTAIVSNAVAKNRQGEALGTFQSLQSFAFAITPFLGGTLLNLSFNIPLILGGIAMFSACLIVSIGYSRRST